MLESLGALELPQGVEIEVIVVDNDPSGSAAELVERLDPSVSGHHALRLLRDPRHKNVAHVRNTAVEAARGTWVAFIDDDEVADKSWLAAYWALAREGPYDGWFGPVLPRLERNVTPWLDLETFYSRPRHSTGTPITAADTRTANAFVRRERLLEQPFDPDFGLVSELTEDYEVFSRMIDRGARFAWCDEAIVVETIPPERHTLRWLVGRSYWSSLMMARVTAAMAPRRSPGMKLLLGVARTLFGAGLVLVAAPTALRSRRAAARMLRRAGVQAGQVRALFDRASPIGPRAR